tara:strand:+ start:445 stop:978 length:534 start_codon:yes stop_codon:yes gene_type:complete
MIETKIKTIQANGTWEGKYGTMYQFEVEMEDSTVGEANAKTPTPPYSVGSTVWYDVKGETKYGKKLKISTSDPNQQQQSQSNFTPQSSDTQTRIENSWAVQTAIQIYGPLPATGYDLQTYLKKVNELAPTLLEMRDNVSKPKVAATNPVKRQTEPRGDMAQQFNESQENPAEDGLPF